MFHAPRPHYHHRRRTLCRNQPPRRPTLTSSFPHRSKVSAEARAYHVSVASAGAFAFTIPQRSRKTGASWKDADLLKLGVPKGKKRYKSRPAIVKRLYRFKTEAAAIKFAKEMLKWLDNPKRVKSKVPTL